jgi:hypothetical protein
LPDIKCIQTVILTPRLPSLRTFSKTKAETKMNIVKNDRHDVDPTEAKLVSVGHYLWKIYWKATDEPGIGAALEAVWQVKREYRQELKTRREASARQLREYWASRKAA